MGHAVKRLNWRWSPGNANTPRGWVCLPGPGTAVAAFDFFADAEDDRRRREAAVRLRVNPFECGPLSMVSSLPEPILRDFIMDAGIDPPDALTTWAAWWADVRDRLSPEQTARVWQAADKVQFFEVAPVPNAPLAHAVVEVLWGEDGEVYRADGDGGEIVGLFRSREAAERRARELTAESRFVNFVHTFENRRPCDQPDPFAPDSVVRGAWDRMPFFEVAPVRFAALHNSSAAHVVLRRDYAPSVAGFEACSWVPFRAFDDYRTARLIAAEMESDARSSFNPFCLARTPGAFRSYPLGPDPPLPEACRRAGVPEPVAGGDYAGWWAEHIAPLPEPERDRFWDVLRVRFFSVSLLTLEG